MKKSISVLFIILIGFQTSVFAKPANLTYSYVSAWTLQATSELLTINPNTYYNQYLVTLSDYASPQAMVKLLNFINEHVDLEELKFSQTAYHTEVFSPVLLSERNDNGQHYWVYQLKAYSYLSRIGNEYDIHERAIVKSSWLQVTVKQVAPRKIQLMDIEQLIAPRKPRKSKTS